MLFNSKIFVAFLIVVLAVYYQLSNRAKIWFLLLMSYVFYGFWDPKLCSLNGDWQGGACVCDPGKCCQSPRAQCCC